MIGWIGALLAALLLTAPFFLRRKQGIDPAELADEDGAFIHVDGVCLYVIEKGALSGPAILLIHGLAGSTVTWRKTIPPLTEAGYHVICFDRPPFGLSDKLPQIDYSHQAQADLIARVMDHYKIDRAALIGHSMGANVSLYFALRHPHRLEKLVIVDGAILLPGGPPSFIGILMRFPPFARWLEVILGRLITPERFSSFILSSYYHPRLITDDEMTAFLRPLKTQGWTRGLVALVRDSGQNQLPEELIRQVEHPTMIVWGENDRVVDIKFGRPLRDLLPNADWLVYPATGHSPMEEQSEKFNEDVLRFLQ